MSYATKHENGMFTIVNEKTGEERQISFVRWLEAHGEEYRLRYGRSVKDGPARSEIVRQVLCERLFERGWL